MINIKKFDSVALSVKEILQQEALKGDQHKIDKNKNNKIDAHDFKILRGEKKAVKEDAEQIDEISSTLANKYLNAPQGKGANKYKVGDTGTTKKNIYPDAETMSKHSKSVRQAIQRSGSSSIFKKPSYYKEEAEQIDEEINVKKDYDDHEQSEHGVYKGKRKIGYIVHNKKSGTHTAYHGHKYGKDDYENSDNFKSHEHALNQIKKSAGINESNNPFDVKNYKSQLPTKPGEKAGFDSKKISTGTVYSRKPVKDEPMKKEEVEQIDELKKTTVKSYLAKKMASLPGKDPKKDQKDMMKAHHRVTGVKPTSEEVEQVDERTLTKGETKEKERIVKGMKKSFKGFKQRYGEKAKSVMYATATKAAKNEEVVTEAKRPESDTVPFLTNGDSKPLAHAKDLAKKSLKRLKSEMMGKAGTSE
jgi:hypothetical protein